MNRQKVFRVITGLLLLAVVASACSVGPSSARTTATPVPTPTLYPTYTPDPTPTSAPATRKGQWVKGHFISIKIVDMRIATELDGARPVEDIFVVVEANWRTNNTTMSHTVTGADFELVDADGNILEISGMIYRSGNMDEPQGSGEKYNKDKYRSNKVQGNVSDTYKLVYDIPSTAKGLKLWFQDFAPIDLGLTLP